MRTMLNIRIFSFLLLSSIFTAASFANTSCQPIYGGGQSCAQVGNVMLNKTVQNPQTGGFVDNLGVNDPKFTSEQNVSFQLLITNTGGNTINKVTVKDIFPQFVTFSSGPGSFDKNINTLSFDVNNLAANETRTFMVGGTTAKASDLPSDQRVICVVNQASATADNNQVSQDNSQLCMQKQAPSSFPISLPTTTKGGLPIQSASGVIASPSTGPEVFGLLALIPSALGGLFLRKKTSR